MLQPLIVGRQQLLLLNFQRLLRCRPSLLYFPKLVKREEVRLVDIAVEAAKRRVLKFRPGVGTLQVNQLLLRPKNCRRVIVARAGAVEAKAGAIDAEDNVVLAKAGAVDAAADAVGAEATVSDDEAGAVNAEAKAGAVGVEARAVDDEAGAVDAAAGAVHAKPDADVVGAEDVAVDAHAGAEDSVADAVGAEAACSFCHSAR
eukprot:6209460-Pleurochrysis_carterae.AAC.1